MNNFDYCSPTRIIFGKDEQKKVGEYVKQYSSNILFHYGGGSIKKSGLYDEVVESLKKAGVKYTEFGGVKPNPRLSLAREGIKLVREKGIDFILAVGGGSVIDSSKAIAAGAKYSGDVWDFYLGKAKVQEALPVATILTIPAAGSESSPNSVLTDEETVMKIGINFPALRPKFSILNPEFCFSLPPEQRANGICDMMAHIFERYFTNTPDSQVADKLCEGVLKAIINNAHKVFENPKNYDAWANIMWAGSLAHNGLLGMSRQEDWGSHKTEHSLSAVYGIAHGAGLAIIFPAWMRYVYKTNIGMFVQFAVEVWGIDEPLRDQEAVVLKAIDKTEAFFKSLGLPTSLKEINAKESDFEMMAEKAAAFGEIGSFKKLSKKDIIEIFKLAYK
ncbi:MAG: iron-containing alcohol dehydrogenase [Elusimicrobiota bacterium]|jgi:alcohol dehydrogenase YqhD (iron-dependent ADH family)|nr:iron-containing alcohol dehydrogenase [Elusimicrobiota bacterium]